MFFGSPKHLTFLRYEVLSPQRGYADSLNANRAYRQLRARRALLQLKDVPLRTRRGLSLYKVNSNSALLVLNGTSFICNSALLALSWRYVQLGTRLGIQSDSSKFQFVHLFVEHDLSTFGKTAHGKEIGISMAPLVSMLQTYSSQTFHRCWPACICRASFQAHSSTP